MRLVDVGHCFPCVPGGGRAVPYRSCLCRLIQGGRGSRRQEAFGSGAGGLDAVNGQHEVRLCLVAGFGDGGAGWHGVRRPVWLARRPAGRGRCGGGRNARRARCRGCSGRVRSREIRRLASWWGDPWVGWRCGIATRVGVLLGAERRRRLAGSFVVAGRGWQKVASVRLTGFCTTVALRNVQQTTCGCRTFHGRRPG